MNNFRKSLINQITDGTEITNEDMWIIYFFYNGVQKATYDNEILVREDYETVGGGST